MKGSVDKRFTELYCFLMTVRHTKELSKERCDELEELIDGLFLKINHVG